MTPQLLWSFCYLPEKGRKGTEEILEEREREMEEKQKANDTTETEQILKCPLP